MECQKSERAHVLPVFSLPRQFRPRQLQVALVNSEQLPRPLKQHWRVDPAQGRDNGLLPGYMPLALEDPTLAAGNVFLDRHNVLYAVVRPRVLAVPERKGRRRGSSRSKVTQ